MKKFIIVLLLFTSTMSFSQSLDSLNRKYEAQQKQMDQMLWAMDKHGTQYSTGTVMAIIGLSVVVISTVALYNDPMPVSGGVYGLAIGGTMTLAGALISIDSHKYFKRKFRDRWYPSTTLKESK